MKQESNRQTTTEHIDGGLHPAVDGHSLGGRKTKSTTHGPGGAQDGNQGETTGPEDDQANGGRMTSK